ncbi:MAG: NUDIX hydrolase [Rhodospirillaceae bacterium]|mgnify:CR=1 FL=1|nr:NUDIX hydrolase [Rhodospirillaceae bacterium]MBT6136337.1 NUDIX hydrolase [Rhodospirillaceae bacterium]
MPEKWRLEESRYGYTDQFLRHRIDRCRTANGLIVEPYHVLEFADWINVVAVTEGLDLLLVREYRHASGELVIGLPGGIVDDADRLDVGPGSDAAARRELREETGGTAARWDEIACVWANPATQTNKVWSYLATGVRISHDTDFDANEDIELVPVPIGEAFARLHRREYMMQGLHVAALFAAEAFLRGRDDEDLADIRHAITGA